MFLVEKVKYLELEARNFKFIDEVFSGCSALEIICSPELKKEIRKKIP